jgi:hypothetical protein
MDYILFFHMHVKCSNVFRYIYLYIHTYIQIYCLYMHVKCSNVFRYIHTHTYIHTYRCAPGANKRRQEKITKQQNHTYILSSPHMAS